MKRQLTEETLNQDYRLKGYIKKNVYNSIGELESTTYYEDVGMTRVMIVETNVYTKNITTGLVESRYRLIEFYDGNGLDKNINLVGVKNSKRLYTQEEGIMITESFRKNVINKAKLHLFNVLNNSIDAVNIFNNMSVYISEYINGDKNSLINSILNNESLLMTEEIKSSLIEIVNV